MFDKSMRILVVGCALALHACVAYEPVVVAPQMTTQQRFDRSWTAALGAMADEGLAITEQNQAAGIARGSRGGVSVTATLDTLPDGAIRVQFGSSPASDAGNDLARRVHEAYQRRMGR